MATDVATGGGASLQRGDRVRLPADAGTLPGWQPYWTRWSGGEATGTVLVAGTLDGVPAAALGLDEEVDFRVTTAAEDRGCNTPTVELLVVPANLLERLPPAATPTVPTIEEIAKRLGLPYVYVAPIRTWDRPGDVGPFVPAVEWAVWAWEDLDKTGTREGPCGPLCILNEVGEWVTAMGKTREEAIQVLWQDLLAGREVRVGQPGEPKPGTTFHSRSPQGRGLRVTVDGTPSPSGWVDYRWSYEGGTQVFEATAPWSDMVAWYRAATSGVSRA